MCLFVFLPGGVVRDRAVYVRGVVLFLVVRRVDIILNHFVDSTLASCVHRNCAFLILVQNTCGVFAG
jgi:hypothetical protein